MDKRARQTELLRIITASSVGSQADLAARLADRGYVVTQASVSRDLEELGVIKAGGSYIRPVPNVPVDLGPVGFTSAGPNLIVGKCSSGLASAITVRIDAQEVPGVVGTIAGDDTIFIAVEGAEVFESVKQYLELMFGREQ